MARAEVRARQGFTCAKKATARFDFLKLTDGLATFVTLGSDVSKRPSHHQPDGDNRLLYPDAVLANIGSPLIVLHTEVIYSCFVKYTRRFIAYSSRYIKKSYLENNSDFKFTSVGFYCLYFKYFYCT